MREIFCDLKVRIISVILNTAHALSHMTTLFSMVFKLCDFGGSRIIDSSTQPLHTICGTPGYLVCLYETVVNDV